jgi:hypothetical protein
VFDIYMVAIIGLLGYALAVLRFEAAPLMLGFVLGPLMEENLRRALLLSRGDALVFLARCWPGHCGVRCARRCGRVSAPTTRDPKVLQFVLC